METYIAKTGRDRGSFTVSKQNLDEAQLKALGVKFVELVLRIGRAGLKSCHLVDVEGL